MTINLLPPTEKNNLQQKENYRLIIILGVLTLLFLIVFCLILLPVKIHISGEVEAEKTLANLEKEKFTTSAIQDLEKEIDSTNQNLLKLDSFYKSQPNFTALMEKISQMLPSSVYLTSLSLTPSLVSLQGYSPSRELLFEFKNKLEAEPSFEEVVFPPTDWTKPKDIDFSVTFKIGP